MPLHGLMRFFAVFKRLKKLERACLAGNARAFSRE